MWGGSDYTVLLSRPNGKEKSSQERADDCRKVGINCALVAVAMYVGSGIFLGLSMLGVWDDALYGTVICLFFLAFFALCSHMELMDARKYQRKAQQEKSTEDITAA